MRGVSQNLSPGVEPSSVEYECRSGQAYNSAFREISGSHIHFSEQGLSDITRAHVRHYNTAWRRR